MDFGLRRHTNFRCATCCTKFSETRGGLRVTKACSVHLSRIRCCSSLRYAQASFAGLLLHSSDNARVTEVESQHVAAASASDVVSMADDTQMQQRVNAHAVVAPVRTIEFSTCAGSGAMRKEACIDAVTINGDQISRPRRLCRRRAGEGLNGTAELNFFSDLCDGAM